MSAVFAIHEKKANSVHGPDTVQPPSQLIAERKIASVEPTKPTELESNHAADIKSNSLNELKKIDLAQQETPKQAPSFQILETTLTPWTQIGEDEPEPGAARPKLKAGRPSDPLSSTSSSRNGAALAARQSEDHCIGVTPTLAPAMSPQSLLDTYGHFSSSSTESRYVQDVSLNSRFIWTMDLSADCKSALGKTVTIQIDGEPIGELVLSEQPEKGAFALLTERILKTFQNRILIPFRIRHQLDGSYSLEIFSPTGNETAEHVLNIGEHWTEHR